MTLEIRPAVLDDAVEVARIQIVTWRAAYVGILPDPVLAGLDDIRTAAFWARLIDRPERHAGVLVAADPDDPNPHLLGFASFNMLRGEAAPDDSRDAGESGAPGWGEVSALYVEPLAQRRGLGGRLMLAACRCLESAGLRGLRIWTLVDNAPGRRFYETRGGVEAATGITRMGGADLPIVAYDWPDSRAIRSII
jgi:GNAT superfamily N-acetyltransferase